MKVFHLISGGDTGGAKTHIMALLSALKEEIDVTLGVFIDDVFLLFFLISSAVGSRRIVPSRL